MPGERKRRRGCSCQGEKKGRTTPKSGKRESLVKTPFRWGEGKDFSSVIKEKMFRL